MREKRFWSCLVCSVGLLLASPRLSACHIFFRASAPPVTAIAFAPDGKTVVIASQRGILLQSFPEGKLLRHLPVDMPNVHDLAFSPDGKWLLAGGGRPAEEGSVTLYSWPSLTRIAFRKDHADSVYSVCWLPDSRGWVTASLDKTLRVYERKTGHCRQILKGHSRGVTAVAVLPDGETIVSAGQDNSLRIWSLKTGGVVRTLNNHAQPVHQLALRPARGSGGLPLVVSVSEDRTLRLWQPTIGRMVRFLRLKRAVPLAVRWLPDGSLLALCGSDGRLRLINPETLAVREDRHLLQGWAYALDVHPQGKEILVGGSGGLVRRFRVPERER